VYSRQVARPVLQLPAGSSIDGTHEVYIFAHSYDYHNFQIVWTPGATGTLSCKIYGAIQTTDSTGVTNSFEDMTDKLYGVAAVTGSAILLNSAKYLGMVSWIKVVATVSTPDASTALNIYYKSKDI